MQVCTKLDVSRFDYTDPALVGDRFHAALRAASGESWIAEGPYGPVLFDRESYEFFLRSRTTEFPGEPLIEMFDVQGRLREVMERNILTVGREDHRRLRALVNPSLGPRGVERHRPAMRTILSDLLDAVEPYGRCDLVSAVTKPYPARVIATVLGAPPEDADWLHGCAHQIERVFDIASMASDLDSIERAATELYDYAEALVRNRRGDPRDDLISKLIAAEVEGDRLSDVEVVHLVLNLLAGGVETVQSQLGQAIRLFAREPDQWRQLRERPELVPRAVEEVLRYEPILPFTARILGEDVVYRDVAFPAGTVLMLCALTGNREYEVGPDPYRFDIAAEERGERLLSFGAGAHYCVGSNLARAELEEALAALSERFATIELDGEPVFGSMTGLYGLDALPIRFTTEGGATRERAAAARTAAQSP